MRAFWLVIEGDNGAGKDTLSDRLAADGWFSASRDPRAIAEKNHAASLSGIDRVNAFLSYNETCGTLAEDHPSQSVVVRYWPSTLAAAFADKILDWGKIEELVQRMVHHLPLPAMILFLKCSLNARRDRVERRGLVPGAVDDTSDERDQRYQIAIQRIAKHPGVPKWTFLETTDLNAEQVYQSVRRLVATETPL